MALDGAGAGFRVDGGEPGWKKAVVYQLWPAQLRGRRRRRDRRPGSGPALAFVRRHAGAQLLVLANVSGTEVAVEVPEAERWAEADLVLVNVPAPHALRARLTLRPREARVHRRA